MRYLMSWLMMKSRPYPSLPEICQLLLAFGFPISIAIGRTTEDCRGCARWRTKCIIPRELPLNNHPGRFQLFPLVEVRPTLLFKRWDQMIGYNRILHHNKSIFRWIALRIRTGSTAEEVNCLAVTFLLRNQDIVTKRMDQDCCIGNEFLHRALIRTLQGCLKSILRHHLIASTLSRNLYESIFQKTHRGLVKILAKEANSRIPFKRLFCSIANVLLQTVLYILRLSNMRVESRHTCRQIAERTS